MPENSLEISNTLNNLNISNDNFINTTTISNHNFIDNNFTTDTNNFTIGTNTNNTSLGYFSKQHICLFDSLYFEQRESNILIINYEKALIWDENCKNFKIINIKNFKHELIEGDEKFDSINNNLTFNSNFTNEAQIFLTLLLEQNDLVFIDTEKNKNYKFCSKSKKWILLDSKSFFYIEFENNITIFDIKHKINFKELLIEKKTKLNFLNTGFIFAPYVTLDGTVTITENINNNNRIYNSDLLSRYSVGVDVSNSYNYITGTTMMYGTLGHP